jgi:hypothetical protein
LGYFLSKNYQILTRNFFGKKFLFTKAPFWAIFQQNWALFFTKRLVTLMTIAPDTRDNKFQGPLEPLTEISKSLDNNLIIVRATPAGLPDGTFANQKSQIGYVLEGLGM